MPVKLSITWTNKGELIREIKNTLPDVYSISGKYHPPCPADIMTRELFIRELEITKESDKVVVIWEVI